jgi:hypothetical protein
MLRYGLPVAIVLIAGVPAAFAQECLHGRSETSSDRSRREQALRMAHQINLAQVIIVGPGPLANRRYRPLEELGNIPPTPRGFQVQFHTDGETYTFALKDTLDPCHYAIFSDQDKRIYEAIPTTRPVVVPATGN